MLRAMIFAAIFFAQAALGSPEIQNLLARSIIDSNTPLQEVQAFTEARVPPMPVVDSAADWKRRADRWRKDTLDKVVFRGEAAKWRNQETKVVWLETIEGGPEYRIRKLRYEAVPGMWIPALLYEPISISGKVPAALHVNGHEGAGKAIAYKQIRCINLAKRGMLVLNLEWIGMGQLRGTDYAHYRMNQLDLCGTSGLAPFYLAMKRGLDVLLEHRNADPERVSVSGLSGGGWQTIFISSLDTRVTLANPVAGYSSFRTRARFLSDLGDSEQTPCDLATVVDYAHLTAMMAPRPTLLTYNYKDNCCFASPHALPPLLDAARPVFDLFGKKANLREHVNHDPGDHNFGLDNRQALYRMVAEHFYGNDASFAPIEISCDGEVKNSKELEVELPADNAHFNSLALTLSRDLPNRRADLREVLRATNYAVRAEPVKADGATYWKLRLNEVWTVPAAELKRGDPSATVILISENGRKSLAREAEELLQAGKRVLAVDPFYFGESKIRSHDFLFALLVSAVGERPLGIQASQIAALARWARTEFANAPVEVIAVGPRSSLIALCAAALDPAAISKTDLRDSFASLKDILEKNISVDKAPELFCFGLLESFDIPHLRSLARAQ